MDPAVHADARMRADDDGPEVGDTEPAAEDIERDGEAELGLHAGEPQGEDLPP